MICLPRIREELCSSADGLTLRSETESSLSYIILVKAMNQPSKGIYPRQHPAFRVRGYRATKPES